jgi:hypothetical protein
MFAGRDTCCKPTRTADSCQGTRLSAGKRVGEDETGHGGGRGCTCREKVCSITLVDFAMLALGMLVNWLRMSFVAG